MTTTPIASPWADILTAHALRITLHHEKATLHALCTPRITDTRHIADIVEAIRVTVRPRCRKAYRERTLTDHQAAVAIGTLLALYSPASLIGEQIRPTLRTKIAVALHRTNEYVSRKKHNLYFLYLHDNMLRADIDKIISHYTEIIMHTYTNTITLYATSEQDGTQAVWDKPPYYDEAAGQWVGAEAGFIGCTPCPALTEALAPLLSTICQNTAPVAIKITATRE